MWYIPPMIGQKVMLNPEHEKYESDRAITGGVDGYIVALQNHNDWMYSGHVDNIEVLWENGSRLEYRPNQLLPIDNYKQIRIIRTSEGIQLPVKNKVYFEKIVNNIIREDERITSDMTYGKEERLNALEYHHNNYKYASASLQQNEHALERYKNVQEEIVKTKSKGEPELLEI